MATMLASGVHCLVRYGAVPEVARCPVFEEPLDRGAEVVLETHRGLQLGSIVQVVAPANARTRPPEGEADAAESDSAFTIVRRATPADQRRQQELRSEAEQEFSGWVQRIEKWGVDVQLIDLEWTLDRAKLVLYVLNERGPECTKLAIQAAAGGFGVIEVQPVAREGLVSQPSGGGCGSCGCHS